MINVTTKELQQILKTIDDALAMHGKWLDGLHRTFACRLPPADSQIAEDAHQRCAFGQWFYGKNNGNCPRCPSLPVLARCTRRCTVRPRTSVLDLPPRVAPPR